MNANPTRKMVAESQKEFQSEVALIGFEGIQCSYTGLYH
jgi:hypothetical protein